jgi:hypothetical protein
MDNSTSCEKLSRRPNRRRHWNSPRASKIARRRFNALQPITQYLSLWFAASLVVLAIAPHALGAIVTLSAGTSVTTDDIAQFDTAWMSDPQGQLSWYEYALKNRQPWVQWDSIEASTAMVRMFELTHDPKYLDHLGSIADIMLRYRDDHHPGDDFPNGNNPNCMVCQPPFRDGTRGNVVQGAWGSGLYSDWVNGGGLDPIDAVTSGDYAYPIVAFARIVAEDPSVCTALAVYRQDPSYDQQCRDTAVSYANAGIDVLKAFASGLVTSRLPDGFNAGTINHPPVYATRTQCDDALKAANDHLSTYPPGDSDQVSYYRSQITNNQDACQRQAGYIGQYKTYPYNEAGALMSSFVELWRALDSDFYRQSPLAAGDAPLVRALTAFAVARHQRYFFHNLRYPHDTAQGTHVEWNYNEDAPTPGVEDASHGNLDMFYVSVLRNAVERMNAVTAPAGEPIPLDDAVVRRFANTYLQEIARPAEIDAGGNVHCHVDGTSHSCADPTVYNSVSFGWAGLASVDPTLYRIVRELALRQTERGRDHRLLQRDLTMGNHAALLATKRFSRDLIDVDLTKLTGSKSASSDPFGWVFAGQDVQDVTFRGSDGHVYELWRTNNAAGYTNLSANAHAPRAISDPKAYEFPALGTHNVVYVGTDKHLHGLWWTTAAVGHDDLTTLSHASPPSGNPFPYVSPPFGVQNVAYRGTDRHLHVLYWSTGAVGHDDITKLSGAPALAGDPFAYFITSQGVQNIVYRGVDGHLHGLYWGLGAVGHDDLTLLSGAPAPTGNPTAYVTSAGVQTVVYRGTDGHIHALYWTTGAVSHDDLSENGVSGAPLPIGDVEAYFNAQDGSNHVVYRTSNGHLHELSWTTGAVAHADLTTVTPAVPSAGKASGYVFGPDRTQHVIYRDGAGHLHDLAWQTPDSSVIFLRPASRNTSPR